MGAEVPYAVHSYIFGHLLGQEPIGRHRDYVLDQFSEFASRVRGGGAGLTSLHHRLADKPTLGD